jgi:hypothetical protein
MVHSSFLACVIKKGRESSRPFARKTKKPRVPEEVPRLSFLIISSGQQWTNPSIVLFHHHQFIITVRFSMPFSLVCELLEFSYQLFSRLSIHFLPFRSLPDGSIEKTIPPVKEIFMQVNINAYSHEVVGINYFDFQRKCVCSAENLVLYDDGDDVVITTRELPVRFLLISGKPIGEPVAWYGPIVMNTQEELQIAFEEYEKGTFIKQK